MNISSSNTNTGNLEGKSITSKRFGQEKVVIIESNMDDDMQLWKLRVKIILEQIQIIMKWLKN